MALGPADEAIRANRLEPPTKVEGCALLRHGSNTYTVPNAALTQISPHNLRQIFTEKPRIKPLQIVIGFERFIVALPGRHLNQIAARARAGD